MINMHTKFEVSGLSRSSDILGGTQNFKMGNVTWVTRDNAHFRDGLSSGLAVLNPNTKFEVSTITCNEDTVFPLIEAPGFY